MTQPVDWSDLVWITFVADGSTPPEFAAYVGKTVGLRAAAVPDVGTESELMGIPGVLRSGAAGLEWLMAPAPAVPVNQIPALAQQILTRLTGIETVLANLNSKLGG